ncbi:hypothetical protein FGG08_007505 [Glutinoglossum americanum]|uniref:SPX domain-containing protein n=1 Tax=Glutinoglossum americanum TaxID=1670608 RepID=A0A9P8HZ43_9PEZI|nr:hypothetical protein FGG08_007505 [Glutinoglossum americanum]
MKYGQTLQQRSIPEWGPYNVEYNDIKYLIKVRTTRDQAHAISIPGRGNGENTALVEFEDELYAELSEQHQRIDLFVFSKSGEISRRLNHLDRQVIQLRGRSKASVRTRMSVRRLEKFSKVEEEVLRAGGEIQSLSQFVGAQRLAFHKLLKKYKKWTGSPTLGKRFRQEILGQPTSFSNINLESLVAEWAAVLAAVREPFKDGVSLQPGYGGRRVSLGPLPAKGKTKLLIAGGTSRGESRANSPSQFGGNTSAAQIHSITEDGSDVDLDTALATLPLGPTAGKATYWVHPDDLVQLHVLLLQHMRMRAARGKTQTPTPPSPAMSRTSSLTWRSGFGIDERGDEAGLVIFGDLERFAEGQRAATMGEAEDRAGKITEKAAASVRWCADSEAVVVAGAAPLDTSDSANPRRPSKRRIAKLKKKNISALFDLKQPLPPQRRGSDLTPYSTESAETSARNMEEVRTWLSQHEEICPLVQIRSKRTRFHCLTNSPSSGTWAVLDRDIKMEKAYLEEIGKTGTLTPPMEEGNIASALPGDKHIEFPYAVLEVRWEGDDNGLVPVLDDSHLTERVRGFSTEIHAIAVLHEPKNMPPPLWISALKKDIRKLPASSKPPLRRSSHSGFVSTGANTSASTASTTDDPSSTFTEGAHESSATSEADLLQSPPPSALKKKKRRKPYQEHPPRKRSDEDGPVNFKRYWNEYDDGDEAPEDEPYTIFVDPNEPAGFPGMEGISRLRDIVVAKFQSASTKVKEWLPPSPKGGEQQPLLGENNRFIPYDTDLEDSSLAERAIFSRRQYSTIVEQEAQQTLRAREQFLIRAYVACFSASVLLLSLVFVLAITGKHKFHIPVDLGVITGVIASLSFAVTGMVMMLVRKTRVGSAQRFVVLTTFGAICVASGVLLALVGTGG